jgi:hypothetical protein
MPGMKMKQQQIQVSSGLHNLIHAMIEAEKWIAKVKILIDEMIKDDDK